MGLFFILSPKTLGCSDGQWHSWFAGTTCLTFRSSQRPGREGGEAKWKDCRVSWNRVRKEEGWVGQQEPRGERRKTRQRGEESLSRRRQSVARGWRGERGESRLHWPLRPRAFSPGSACIWRKDNGKTSREFSNENQIGWWSVLAPSFVCPTNLFSIILILGGGNSLEIMA